MRVGQGKEMSVGPKMSYDGGTLLVLSLSTFDGLRHVLSSFSYTELGKNGGIYNQYKMKSMDERSDSAWDEWTSDVG